MHFNSEHQYLTRLSAIRSISPLFNFSFVKRSFFIIVSALLCYGIMGNSALAQGFAKVESGVFVSPANIYANGSPSAHNLAVTFTLRETAGSSITIQVIAVAIEKNVDGIWQHQFDLGQTFENITISANGDWTYPSSTGYLNHAGNFRAVARLYINSVWYDFQTTGPGVNPREFTVLPLVQELDLLVSPTGTQTIGVGDTYNFSFAVNSQGSGVSGATIGFGDPIIAATEQVVSNIGGNASYSAQIPTWCSIGLYTFTFVAIADGYAHSNSVSRSIEIVQGFGKVETGVIVSPSVIYANGSPENQNINVSFSLRETLGYSIIFPIVAVGIEKNVNGNWENQFDLLTTYSDVNLQANGSWNFPPAMGYIDTPGEYRAVARLFIDDGWLDFQTIGSGVNPRNFTALPVPVPGNIMVSTPQVSYNSGESIEFSISVIDENGIPIQGAPVGVYDPIQLMSMEIGSTDEYGNIVYNSVASDDVGIVSYGFISPPILTDFALAFNASTVQPNGENVASIELPEQPVLQPGQFSRTFSQIYSAMSNLDGDALDAFYVAGWGAGCAAGILLTPFTVVGGLTVVITACPEFAIESLRIIVNEIISNTDLSESDKTFWHSFIDDGTTVLTIGYADFSRQTYQGIEAGVGGLVYHTVNGNTEEVLLENMTEYADQWVINASGEGRTILAVNSDHVSRSTSILTVSVMTIVAENDTNIVTFGVLGEDLVDAEETSLLKPANFRINQNHPNPFNPTTTISYDLPEQSDVKLTVFDLQGQQIMTLQDGMKFSGNYEVQWNGMDQSGDPVSTGVYFCRLQAGTFSQTIKMVYLR